MLKKLLASLVFALLPLWASAQLNPVLTPPSSVGWVPNGNGAGSHILFTSQGTMVNMPNGNLSAFLESPGLFNVTAGGGLPVGAGLATRTVPVTLAGKVTTAGIAKAVGTIAGTLATNPYVALGIVAAPYIYDWFNRAGVTTNPNGTFSKLSAESSPGISSFSDAVQAACQAWSFPPGAGVPCVSSLYPGYTNAYQITKPGRTDVAWDIRWNVVIPPPSLVPASVSDVVAQLATVQPDPNVIKEIFTIDQTGRYSDQLLKDLSIQNVVASGPATVSGPSTTTSNPATPTAPASTTTAKTDYNCSYVMADVTCNKTVTTTSQQTGTDPATGQPYASSAPTVRTTGAATPTSTPAPVTCGLPGTPECAVKVDEVGTPAPYVSGKYSQVATDYKTSADAARTTIAGTADKGFLSGWSVFFTAPAVATCQPIVLPNGMSGASMGSLNPCPVVDGMRTVMAYIWALGGFWLCLGMIKRTF